MARPKSNCPAYRRQKHPTDEGKDRAFVVIDGQRRYLGTYDTPQSRAMYHRLLAEWSAGVHPVPTVETPSGGRLNDTTIFEVVAVYWDHLDRTVARPANYRSALDMLTDLYGYLPAREFGSEHLITIQQAMAEKEWSSKYVNENVGRIRKVFKWGVPRKLAPKDVWIELQFVENLPRNLDGGRGVQPAPLEHVEAVKSYVSRQVWAMIELQLLTGARPGEITAMRPIDIDTTSDPWEYRPPKHKMRRTGKDRVIYLGPHAQRILTPFLPRCLDAYVFSPRQAVEEQREGRHAKRRTPLSCGNRPGTNRKSHPCRCAGERYTTVSYARAIRRAVKLAFRPRGMTDDEYRNWKPPQHWHPNQLRHNFATNIRADHGLDVAATLLGHSKVETTQIYAEQNHARARDVARRTG